MKKVLMILLSIAMVFSMAGIVAADDEVQQPELTSEPKEIGYDDHQLSNGGTDGPVYVEYTLTSQKYTVQIPADFDFAKLGTNTVKAKVVVTDVSLKSGNTLLVSVKSEHGFKMLKHANWDGSTLSQNDILAANNPYINYTMTYGDNEVLVKSDTYDEDTLIELVSVESGTVLKEVPLTFKMTGQPTDLGTFRDLLTFSAKIVEPTTPTPTSTE